MSAYENNTSMNMPETCHKATAMDGKAWLTANWPVMLVADVNYTMKRGDFPSYVKDYICNSGDWIKVNDENGGTYCEKVYFEQSCKKKMLSRGVNSNPDFEPHKKNDIEHNINSEDKTVLKVLKTDGPISAIKHMFTNNKTKQTAVVYNGMDERNKAALKVLETEGSDAAVRHMYTDDETGRQLSYSEMRSRYG